MAIHYGESPKANIRSVSQQVLIERDLVHRVVRHLKVSSWSTMDLLGTCLLSDCFILCDYRTKLHTRHVQMPGNQVIILLSSRDNILNGCLKAMHPGCG